MGNQFSSNAETLFNQMESYCTTKTVVGEPIHIGDVILLPLVELSFGMGLGGVENNGGDKNGGAGGGGVGAKISPSAVIMVHDGNVQLVNVKNEDGINKLIDMVPGVLSKLGKVFKKDKEEAGDKEAAE